MWIFDTKLVKVSIVIPAFNEAMEIPSIISEMENQTYKDREIIIVDDSSTDDTYKVALECSNRFHDIKVINTKHGGPSHARNEGVKKATGDIVFFGECDCVYNSDYVEKAVSALENPHFGAVCLTGAPLVQKSTIATDCIQLENRVQHELLKEGKIKPFYAWVFRRSDFERAGGFDEALFQAEDRDLFRRITKSGTKVAWVPGINWRHKRSETLAELARKWYVRARTRVLFSVKHGLALDIGKTMSPLWITFTGTVLLFLMPTIGLILILFVVAAVLVQAVRIIEISHSQLKDTKIYFEYPMFLLVRNFSSGLGYTVGVLRMLLRKLQGKTISYKDL